MPHVRSATIWWGKIVRVVRLAGLWRYEQYLIPTRFLGGSGPRRGHFCCAGVPDCSSSLTACSLTLPQIFFWKLRREDSDFSNFRYYIAWKDSVPDHTSPHPKLQGEGLSVPSSWHQPAGPLARTPPEVAALPAVPVPCPPWELPAAETVPGAVPWMHIMLQRYSSGSQRIHALFCSESQTEYCRFWGFFLFLLHRIIQWLKWVKLKISRLVTFGIEEG